MTETAGRQIRAWTVIPEGRPQATADLWATECVAKTKSDACGKAAAKAGISRLQLASRGLTARKITITIDD